MKLIEKNNPMDFNGIVGIDKMIVHLYCEFNNAKITETCISGEYQYDIELPCEDNLWYHSPTALISEVYTWFEYEYKANNLDVFIEWYNGEYGMDSTYFVSALFAVLPSMDLILSSNGILSPCGNNMAYVYNDICLLLDNTDETETKESIESLKELFPMVSPFHVLVSASTKTCNDYEFTVMASDKKDACHKAIEHIHDELFDYDFGNITVLSEMEYREFMRR